MEPPSADDWSDVERIMSWGLLVQGRLDALSRMLPDGQNWPPRSFFRTPHPLLGLIWRGEVERTRALFDEVPAATVEGAHTDLWFYHEAWLLWAEGDLSAALRAAERAVDHSRKTRFGWEPCFQVVVGYMLIELGRLDAGQREVEEHRVGSTRRIGANADVRGLDVSVLDVLPLEAPERGETGASPVEGDVMEDVITTS